MRVGKGTKAVLWVFGVILTLTLALTSFVWFPRPDRYGFLGSRRPTESGVLPRVESLGGSTPAREARVYVLDVPFESVIGDADSELSQKGFVMSPVEARYEFRVWTRDDTSIILLPGRAASWKDMMHERETDKATHSTVLVQVEIAEDLLYEIRRSVNQLED